MTLWMYTAVVTPILTYGALVWWPALSKKYNIDKLTRIQRTACAGATGAKRSCPSMALNAILNLLPIELHITSMVSQQALRLKESDCWKARNTRHNSILSKTQIRSSTKTCYATAKLVLIRSSKQ